MAAARCPLLQQLCCQNIIVESYAIDCMRILVKEAAQAVPEAVQARVRDRWQNPREEGPGTPRTKDVARPAVVQQRSPERGPQGWCDPDNVGGHLQVLVL